MFQLDASIGDDHLALDGDLTAAEALPLLTAWLAARPPAGTEPSARVTQRLDAILTHTRALLAQGVRAVVNLKDIQDKLVTIGADVESETDVATSVETLLDGQTTLLLDLKAKLEEALANNDQAALQAVADALDTIATTNTANKARTVAAVLKNTPAAPPVAE